MHKEVYVISDLHLGGRPAQNKEVRGFQLATHTDVLADFIYNLAYRTDPKIELVVNGDIVDFLAETPFEAFTESEQRIVQKLKRIVEQEFPVFDAFKLLLANGHRLVFTLGNHDIELAMPTVRTYLESILEAQGRDFAFIYDGEAYTIGKDVIIEHGNRYDTWNKIDNNQFRLFRSQISRQEQAIAFQPPKGSLLVEQIMNPLKQQYKFIDLLKPETTAAIPILLALEPSIKEQIGKLLSISLGLEKDTLFANKTLERSTQPSKPVVSVEDIGHLYSQEKSWEDHLIAEEIAVAFGQDEEVAKDFLEAIASPPQAHSSTQERSIPLSTIFGLADLWFRREEAALEKRLPALLKALKALQNDQSFSTTPETAAEYWAAAKALRQNGFKYVLFGHTHLCKQVPFENGGYYFNSGTWIDFIKFPKAIVAAPKKEALVALRQFVEELVTNDLQKHLRFKPTYVRIVLDEKEEVVDIGLKEYDC